MRSYAIDSASALVLERRGKRARRRRGGEDDVREAAAWLVERLREELSGTRPNSAECEVRQILGPNGQTLLESSDADSLVQVLRQIVFVSYDACSTRYQGLVSELEEARASLDVERELVALVDSLDSRLPRRSLAD